MEMSSKKGYVNIATSLPPDLKAKALRRAEELDLTMSQYIRRLVRAELKKTEEEKRKREKEQKNDGEL